MEVSNYDNMNGNGNINEWKIKGMLRVMICQKYHMTMRHDTPRLL